MNLSFRNICFSLAMLVPVIVVLFSLLVWVDLLFYVCVYIWNKLIVPVDPRYNHGWRNTPVCIGSGLRTWPLPPTLELAHIRLCSLTFICGVSLSNRLSSIHSPWPPSPQPPHATMQRIRSWRTCVSIAIRWYNRPWWYVTVQMTMLKNLLFL